MTVEYKLNLDGRKALPKEAKKYTTPPCALCGWGPREAIHTNPRLMRDGGFYHPFSPIASEGDNNE